MNPDIQIAAIGIAVGVLIALITGTNFVFMLRTLAKAASWKEGFQVAVQIAAIPTFWFGGPWVTTKIIAADIWTKMAPWYVGALAVGFGLIIGVPLVEFIKRVAKAIRDS